MHFVLFSKLKKHNVHIGGAKIQMPVLIITTYYALKRLF